MSSSLFSRLLSKLTHFWNDSSSLQEPPPNPNRTATPKDLQSAFAQREIDFSEAGCDKLVKVHFNSITQQNCAEVVDDIIKYVWSVYMRYEQNGGISDDKELAKALEDESYYEHNWSPGFLERLIKAADPVEERGINSEQFVILMQGIQNFISNQRWLPTNVPLPSQERFEEYVMELITMDVLPTDNCYLSSELIVGVGFVVHLPTFGTSGVPKLSQIQLDSLHAVIPGTLQMIISNLLIYLGVRKSSELSRHTMGQSERGRYSYYSG